MLTDLPHFGFYGRDKELDQLVRALTLMHNTSFALFGRRRIGKTELLVRAISHVRDLPPSETKPIVYLEVQPNTTRIGEELQQAIIEAGLKGFMADLKRTSSWDQKDSERFFFDQARHLVAKGGVICLDEFHNLDVEESQLIYYIKRIIDVNQSSCHNPQPNGGGIIAAGSHQQNMIRLLKDPREPLYGRFLAEQHLTQLKTPSLLEMAAEQGWLRNPGQFLTLYSAYGGVPGLWQQYHAACLLDTTLQYDPATDGESLEQWQERFWHYESLRPLRNVRDSYDYKGMIELAPTAERILQVMSRKPNGTPREEIFALDEAPSTLKLGESWNDHLEDKLYVLEERLQMINGIKQFKSWTTLPHKYRISDNDIRHQLLVKRLGIDARTIGALRPKVFVKKLPQIWENEGKDLERIAAEYFGSMVKYGVPEYNVQLPGGGPEIDILVWTANHDLHMDDAIILGSCQRSAKKIIDVSPSPKEVFGAFLSNLYDKQGQPRPPEIRYVLVAPYFTDEQHRILQERGFETADLKTMARALGNELDQKND